MDRAPVEDSKMVWSDLDMTCFSESDSEKFEDRETRDHYFNADYRVGRSWTFGSTAVMCIDTGRGSSNGESAYELRDDDTGTANNRATDQTGRNSRDITLTRTAGDSNFSSRSFCEDERERGVSLTVGPDYTDLMTCEEKLRSNVYRDKFAADLDDSGFNSTTGHI